MALETEYLQKIREIDGEIVQTVVKNIGQINKEESGLRTVTFEVKCKGRDSSGKEVLSEPVSVKVMVYQSPRDGSICLDTGCPYNGGDHGTECNVPHTLKLGEESALCAYSAEIPHCVDILRRD